MAIINEEQREILARGLSNDQTDALVMMINFLHMEGPDIFVLKGYAGTGKTFLINHLLSYLSTNTKFKHGTIALTTPTNKAVEVIKARARYVAPGIDIKYRTIHSLLGLREWIDDDGNITFVNDKSGTSEIHRISLLIVDEGSMLQDDLFKKIKIYSSKIKIIVMGDPAQIPPIRQRDCIPFREAQSNLFEEGYTLRKIMRQSSGNPIIDVASAVRDNLDEETPVQLTKTLSTKDGKGMFLLNAFTEKDKLKELMVSYFMDSAFVISSDYCKVIAWRNKTVDYVNNYIRCRMYGESNAHERINNGEKLIADKPIFDPDGKNVILNTSEEVVVNSVQITSAKFKCGPYEETLKYYNCRMSKIIGSSGMSSMVKVLHHESKTKYGEYLAKIKARAEKLKKGVYWVEYYRETRLFAHVSYNYAITAHKAQGSTYNNVFVLEDDLDANPHVRERNRIKYTAYTRASDRLYIFKKLGLDNHDNHKQNQTEGGGSPASF